MESFTTICTTCGRRLRVRDVKLVGQIVTCPNCGGMVQITAPPQPPADPAPSDPQRIAVGPADEYDSQAITRDSIDGEQIGAAEGAESCGDRSGQSRGRGAVFNEADLAVGGNEASLPANAAETPAGRPVGWQSDRTRRARQIGLIATLSITGIAAAALVFLLFVQRWQERQPVPTASVTLDADESTPEAKEQATNDSAEEDVTSDTDRLATEEPDDSSSGGTVTETETPDAENPQDDESQGGGRSTDPAEPNPTSAEEESAGQTVVNAAGARGEERIPAGLLGPLDRDSEPAEKAKPAAAELPPGLQKYASLLGAGGDGNEAEERLEAPPTVDQVKLDAAAAQQESAFGPAAAIDIGRWLRFEVAFEKKSAPLTQWLRILSQITGVPIALDVASLDAAGVSPTASSEPASGWTTAEAVLETVARHVGCTVRQTDALVIVESDSKAIDAGIRPALQVDDLLDSAGGIERREALARLVKRIAQAESAAIDPDSGLLSVGGDPGTAWLAALTLEGLRLARQQPPRLPRERTVRWLSIDQGFDWPLVQGGQGLSPVDHPQPIISLIGQVAEANDATVVFAWGDLWQHGLTPESVAMPWTSDVAGGELLARLLAPYRLQVRQMSDDLWWVGSQALYDRDRAVGLVHVRNRDGDAAIERLANSLGMPQDELSVAFDEASGYLVAQLPRFLLRQLPQLVDGGKAETKEGPPAERKGVRNQ